MKKLIVLIITFSLFGFIAFPQVYTNKIAGKKNEALKDSVESKGYPYVLPILGKQTAAKGFQLPYSAGIGVTFLWQESDLIISDLMVGFNNGPMYDMDEIIRFNSAVATADAINIRPDIWLFPFLNVYGVFAKANTTTSIDAGVWLPDFDSVWSEVGTISTEAKFDAVSLGFGLTPTIGVGGAWITLDMNVAWTDVSALDKPVFTFMFGPRVGKTFRFKKPDMNIAGWVGGIRVHYASETSGSINLSEVIPVNEIQAKVDQGIAKIGETEQQLSSWWESLSPAEQKNPVNKAKYEAGNRALDKAGELLAAADGALNDGEETTVQYSLEKNLKNKWNFVIGTQFQINRHLMVRAEYGFLGSRQQFIGGIQYRFGL
jgi:hypothetical protein